MSLSVWERLYFDANGFVAKTGLFGLDWIQRVKDEIEDLHDRMARDVVEGVGFSWEEFGDQNMPNLILAHLSFVRRWNSKSWRKCGWLINQTFYLSVPTSNTLVR
jgi:hypothetical protein